MVREDRKTWKANYFAKLEKCLTEYTRFFLVSVDNVGSKQMQQIRIALRGRAEVVMGKNTMMRKAIRGVLQSVPALEKVLTQLTGNVGFIFTSDDLQEIREIILSNKKEAPARAGAIAPLDVMVPAGNTGQGPEKTSFFQALAIPTKIARGTIEILSDIALIKTGDKVGASEAALLAMLNIRPFHYGCIITQVYDNGSLFKAEILDIKDDDIIAKFMEGVSNIAAVSLAIGYPTTASVPHSIVNGFKNVLAVGLEMENYEMEAVKKIKEMLANPELYAAAAPAASAVEEKKEEAKKEESEDESDDDMGFGLFD